MTDRVALLRGINVGVAKRIAMADLRAVYEGLGFTRVATLLNSGNVVFSSDAAPDPAVVREAVRAATGVDSEVVLLDSDTVRRIAADNPLRQPGRDPRRLSVAFAAAPLDPAAAVVPPPESLGAEELVVSRDAVYQWLPDGVTASRVPPAFWKALGTTVTARNDATVLRLVELLSARAAS